METIFHEKQEGSLCAQHCLNALLQGNYFTPIDLGTLAQQMDDEERMRMAESGVDTEEYMRFVSQPSGNMDDSGYFSVQVISAALKVWGLDLIPFNSSEDLAVRAQRAPEALIAYICNYRDHWFTIRKLGNQWFNLNSLLSGPELISTTYLAMFLTQLQQEGYSIFIVTGDLPVCSADDALRRNPAVHVPKRPLIQSSNPKDLELQKAIKLSLGEDTKEDDEIEVAMKLSLEELGEDPTLNKAIKVSLQDATPASSDASLSVVASEEGPLVPSTPDQDSELEAAILLSLQGEENANSAGPAYSAPKSIQRSNKSPAVPGTSADAAEVRLRRLAYLEKKTTPNPLQKNS